MYTFFYAITLLDKGIETKTTTNKGDYMSCNVCNMTVGASNAFDPFIPTTAPGVFKNNVYICICSERWKMVDPHAHVWRMTHDTKAPPLPPDVHNGFALAAEYDPQYW